MRTFYNTSFRPEINWPGFFLSEILAECNNDFLVNYLWPKCSVIIFVKFPVNTNQHFLLAICKTLARFILETDHPSGRMIRLKARIYTQTNYKTNYRSLPKFVPDGWSVSSINRAIIFPKLNWCRHSCFLNRTPLQCKNQLYNDYFIHH